MILDKQKTYLITGGSGFLGKELISRLHKNQINNIVTISRND